MALPFVAVPVSATEKAAAAHLEPLGFVMSKIAQGSNTRVILSRSKTHQVILPSRTTSSDVEGRDR